MAMKEIVIFISCMLCSISDSVNIHCKYYAGSYVSVVNVYSCNLLNTVNIKSKESASIDSETGNHSKGKGNADVGCFYSENSGRVIQFFPRYLENIFTNLKLIVIRHGRLKELQQSDLQSFSKLVHLDLDANDIEILEDGLFAYNPDLIYICIKRNRIIHIGQQVFEDLNKLAWLNLESNKCINIRADSNQTDVKKVTHQVKLKCLGFTGIEKNLQMLENSLLCVNPETLPIFDQKLQNLQIRFQNSSVSHYMPIKERFQDIISWKSKLFLSVNERISIIETSAMNSTSEILIQMKSLKTELNDNLMRLGKEMSFKITELESSFVNLSSVARNSSQTAEKSLENGSSINDNIEILDKSLNAKIVKMTEILTKSINDRITGYETIWFKALELKKDNFITLDFSRYCMIGFCLILSFVNIVLIIFNFI
ncbi:unnamed protein product [Chironomus riparius]|uniref:Uncharacterized protein n=1 Tax=Chironomus riparius TaxID=315576 RepID=A0A9N9RNT2_9DIPT|nr:unnamed protein product [Chironomus riparius]